MSEISHEALDDYMAKKRGRSYSRIAIDKLNFVKRNFLRKIDKGSQRGSIISWIRMTLGVGVVAIPYCFSKFGLILGVIVIFINYLYSLVSYTITIIFDLGKRSQKNEIYDIVKYYLGNGYSKLYKFSIICDMGSNYILYPLINLGILQNLLMRFNLFTFDLDSNGDILHYTKKNFIFRIIYAVVLFIVSFTILLKRSIDNMNFISTIFLFLIIYFILLILGETYGFYNNLSENNNLDIEYFRFPKGDFINSLTSVLLSYYLQPFVFQIKNELKYPTTKRILKVCRLSLTYELILFTILGIAGYLSFGNNVVDIVILRTPYKGKNDFFMIVGLIAFLVVNIIAISIYNPSMRTLICNSYGIDQNGNKFIYLLVSTLPYLISLTIAVLFPDVIKIFGLLGGVFCNINGFFSIFLIKLKISTTVFEKVYSFVFLLISIFLFVGYFGLLIFN